MTKFTTADAAELQALSDKAIDRYIGFNLCRAWFEKETDANRFLELTIKRSPDTATHYSYGAPCRSRVEKATYRNDPCFEVVYG